MCLYMRITSADITKGRNKPNNNNNNNSHLQDTAFVSQVTEFVGNTSALSTSSSPTPPNPNWLADTGATSHMTPPILTVCRITPPLHIPITLADNSLI